MGASAATVAKPDGVRELCPVDIGPLLARVSAISERVWRGEDALKENDFAVFHHTQHIVFRFIEGNRDPETFYSNPAWMAWQSLLLPVMEQAIAPYDFRAPQFPKAMLARLAAGQVIDLHRDGAGSNLLTHKIHVPLITNPQAFFVSEQRRFHLATGHAYEVDNIKPHGGINRGADDRIHFIFEVYDSAKAAGAPDR